MAPPVFRTVIAAKKGKLPGEFPFLIEVTAVRRYAFCGGLSIQMMPMDARHMIPEMIKDVE